MKRIIITFLIIIFVVVLSACKPAPTLDTCMFAMIEEQSNDGCPEDERTSLLSDFFAQYADQFPMSDYTLSIDPLTYVKGNLPTDGFIRFRYILSDLPVQSFDDQALELVDVAIEILKDIQDSTNSLQESSIRFLFTDDTSLDLVNDYGYYAINGVWTHDSAREDNFEQLLIGLLELEDLEAMQYRIHVGDDQLTMNLDPIAKTARLQYLLYTDGSTPDYNNIIASMRTLLQRLEYDVTEIYAEF